ncbi:MAG: hypothetical protein EPN93_07140 [Spirochaetes bacterium]|nr:MAG: hypothetical protein EPN93_07140 [Spirochaetota bacterium]
MKKTLVSLALVAILSAIPAVAQEAAPAAEKSFLTFPVSVTYYSIYWWRGVELNGKGAGLIWPQAGINLGETGLSVFAAGGVNTDYFAASDSEDRKYSKTLHEFDGGLAYTTEIAGTLTLGLGATYVKYFYHDAVTHTADDPSFIEGALSLGLKVPLNPKIDFYYDYYVKESAAKTPVDEDYYVSFSLTHDFIATDDGFKLTANPWVSYYNNAYLDRKGWSDAGLTLTTAKDYKGTTFTASVNYARSLSKDFQPEVDINGDGISGKLKNHFWAEFGVSRTLQ